VLQPHREFGSIEGRHGEVIDHAFAQGEFLDLMPLNEEENGNGRAVSVSMELSTQDHSAIEVSRGIDDYTGYVSR
jgi:hypothetical protein